MKKELCQNCEHELSEYEMGTLCFHVCENPKCRFMNYMILNLKGSARKVKVYNNRLNKLKGGKNNGNNNS